MSKERNDPEVVLEDIVTDMLENRKFHAYANTDEWLPFFTAMSKIIK
jgi:hypothetical protein